MKFDKAKTFEALLVARPLAPIEPLGFTSLPVHQTTPFLTLHKISPSLPLSSRPLSACLLSTGSLPPSLFPPDHSLPPCRSASSALHLRTKTVCCLPSHRHPPANHPTHSHTLPLHSHPAPIPPTHPPTLPLPLATSSPPVFGHTRLPTLLLPFTPPGSFASSPPLNRVSALTVSSRGSPSSESESSSSPLPLANGSDPGLSP